MDLSRRDTFRPCSLKKKNPLLYSFCSNLLPITEICSLGLLTANIANLVCIKLNLKSTIEIKTK